MRGNAALSNGSGLLSGRADAIALNAGSPDIVFDWKSDVAPNDQDRAAYPAQLLDYVKAVGAKRGGVVYMSLGQINWVEASEATARLALRKFSSRLRTGEPDPSGCAILDLSRP
jgi:hypothetical protein